ncbi:MAG: DUF1836 domain-containing protein [Lachnospiraceae bacterium]|nr:DUF1836 domain-containing protein [Lachnospiraceae bacterium]
MTLNKEELLKSIFDSFSHLDYIRADDIPNIDLYMDQVTTFMNEHLKASKRYEQDKVLTKTMINNYAKNRLLPPPSKKKYSKEHLLVMIFIYYFKDFLSFSDIQAILSPLTLRFFQSDTGFDMEWIYREVYRLGKNELSVLQDDVQRMYEASMDAFSDAPEEDSDFLHSFAMICLLSFDVYIKKQLIEKLVDNFSQQTAEEKANKKK